LLFFLEDVDLKEELGTGRMEADLLPLQGREVGGFRLLGRSEKTNYLARFSFSFDSYVLMYLALLYVTSISPLAGSI